MILVNLPGRTIGLVFNHRRGAWSLNPSKKVHHTNCDIFLVEGKRTYSLTAFGVAQCNPLDQFVKEIGRKRALTRALEAMTENGKISRAERALVWKGYFSRGAEQIMEVVH